MFLLSRGVIASLHMLPAPPPLNYIGGIFACRDRRGVASAADIKSSQSTSAKEKFFSLVQKSV
jgi:hypothetical protein